MPVGGHVVGQRLVEIELAEIDVGHLAEMGQPLEHVVLGEAGPLVLAVLGLFHGLAQDGIDEEQHLAIVRAAPLRHHVLAHIVAIGPHGIDALGVDDDRVGMGGGEFAAAR